MKLEIINIGSELLDGTRVNSNLSSMAKALKKLDLEITRAITVGDDEAGILDALGDCFSRVDMVITTGGLGPTQDDITKKTITKFFGRHLIVDSKTLKNVEKFYKKKGFAVSKFVYNQALIPQGAKVLNNPKGTAPGLIIEEENKVLAAFPGPPEELNYLLTRELIPYLKKKVKISSKAVRIFKIYGLTEVEVNEEIKQFLKEKEINFSFLPRQIEMVLKIESKGENAPGFIQKMERKIRKKLGDTIYGIDEENLEEVVAVLLTMQKKKISVAESCTAGLISHRLTNIPGSSRYFERGFIAYSNKSKMELLGVEEELLRKKGAVSEEVVQEMAIGAKNKANVDLGLAVTGIAGPGGETADKKAGLAYIALAKTNKTIVQKFQFQGERELVKLKVSQAALNIVRLNLIKK